jgi:branched-chain amino acid transport system permease protein
MSEPKKTTSENAPNRRTWMFWVLLGAILIILPFLSPSNFFTHSLVLMLVFAYTGVAWDLLGGYAGQLSLGHSVYFGIGAYCAVLLAEHFGIPPWASMAIAALLAAAVAFIFFYPTFRFGLIGPFFTLTTIGVAAIFALVVANIEPLGGAQGVMLPMKDAGLYWLQYFDERIYYFVGLVMLALIVGISAFVRRSRLGYQLVAVREDEAAAEACGINVGLCKMQITALSAALTAVGGVLYAQVITFVDPTVFAVNMAVTIAVVPIVGGSGVLLGPLVGSIVLTAISNSIQLSVGAVVPGLNLFVYGALLIIVVLMMPEGIAPRIAQLCGRIHHDKSRTGAEKKGRGAIE